MNKHGKLEAIIWSVAFPGFGQFLNGQLVKGITFLLLEFIINFKSRFNVAIMHSFLGEIELAIKVTNFQWLMFYPCVYIFSIYDAYRFAEGHNPAYSYIPFAFAAYAVTVGLMYSTKAYLFGVLLGPVWFPMLCVLPGLAIGFLIRQLLITLRTSL